MKDDKNSHFKECPGFYERRFIFVCFNIILERSFQIIFFIFLLDEVFLQVKSLKSYFVKKKEKNYHYIINNFFKRASYMGQGPRRPLISKAQIISDNSSLTHQ